MYRSWKKWSMIRDYVLLKTLDLISKEPMHGYGILKYFEEEFGIKLSPGLLYPILRKIVHMGLATANEISINGKRAIVYEITPMGREFLEQRRCVLEVFEKKASRIKQCRLHELATRLRFFFVNIDKIREEDLLKLKQAADRFLEDTRFIGV